MAFIFPYIGNSNPNWLSYFSEGLKPSTRIQPEFNWLLVVPGMYGCIRSNVHSFAGLRVQCVFGLDMSWHCIALISSIYEGHVRHVLCKASLPSKILWLVVSRLVSSTSFTLQICVSKDDVCFTVNHWWNRWSVSLRSVRGIINPTTRNGNHTTYKNGDDWGGFSWHCVTYINENPT